MRGWIIGVLLLFTFEVSSQDVSYHAEIQPILSKHCISCHSEGKIGPMPLTNYQEVSSYGAMIKYVTTNSLMPPWLPDTAYTQFKYQNVLNEQELKLIHDWVDGGLVEGEEVSPYEEKQEYHIDDPDFIFEMVDSFEQYGIYYDQYQVFVVETNLDEDVLIDQIEFVPGNADIVRSCTVSLDLSERSDSLDNWDPRQGYYHFGGVGYLPDEYVWYHWSPEKPLTDLGDGFHKLLAKGAKLLFHITYGPTGRKQMDKSHIRLKTARSISTSKRITSIPLITKQNLSNPPFIVQANEVKRFHGKTVLEEDLYIHSVMPQSQLLCKSWEVFATIPEDKKPLKLLKIPDWDFHWKREYEFLEPIFLPKGTTIHAMAKYDNTEANFSNPSIPTTPMKSGFGMFEELFLVHFGVSTTDPGYTNN